MLIAAGHLFNDQNTFAKFVNVYVNDEDIHTDGSNTPLKKAT